MSGSYHRDVGPAIQILRNFLRGRSWNEQLRKQKDLAPRPYPRPELPPGPSHKTSVNYYFTRDARRLVEPTVPLIDNSAKQLTSGQTEVKPSSTNKAPKPGDIYNYS